MSAKDIKLVAKSNSESHGWMRKHVATKINTMIEQNPEIKFPKKIGIFGFGDEEVYISYARNDVRDCLLQTFANDDLVAIATR